MLHQFEKWDATQHPRWLVFLRAALGIILFHKGINFMYNSVELEKILTASGISEFNSWLPLVITWLHLLCGTFIIIGLMTRLATAVMIPILLFAVVFINARAGIFSPGSEFLFSFVTLIALIFFFVRGGGYLSMDQYMKTHLL